MGGNAIDQAIQDVRFSLRALRKAPGFSLVAVITLALGIGATVATFSVVNTVLLRPFAFSHPEKLLWIYSQRSDNPRTNFSLPEYCDYRDQATSFDGLAGVASFNPSFADSGPPERVQGVRMSASAFAMLEVRPLLGRTLIAEDDRNGARGVVVISYGLWSRRYARDPAVIGRPVNLNGETREIVGVLPASFALPNLDTEIVVPLQPDADPRRNVRNSVNFLRMVGRLKPNVTAQQAHAELEAIRQNLQRQYPGIYTGKIGLTLVPLTEEIVMNIKSVLLTIFCAAGAVLLVGCVNLAGISLSRAAARQRELAVRTALGATRGQLTRLLLTESFVLALAGGSLGMLLEVWGQRALLHLVPTDLPRIESFSIDWTVLLFAGVLIFIAALACGLAPAWLLSRSDLRDALVSSGRGSTGGGLQSRLRTWLVSGQIALALVLLANAGLLLRSFMRLSTENRGSIAPMCRRFAFRCRKPDMTTWPQSCTSLTSYIRARRRSMELRVTRSSRSCRLLRRAFRLFISPGRTDRLRGRKTHRQPITASSRQNTFGRWVSHCLTVVILPNRTTPSIRRSRSSARLSRKIIFPIGRLSGSGSWLTIPTVILARSKSLELSVR